MASAAPVAPVSPTEAVDGNRKLLTQGTQGSLTSGKSSQKLSVTGSSGSSSPSKVSRSKSFWQGASLAMSMAKSQAEDFEAVEAHLDQKTRDGEEDNPEDTGAQRLTKALDRGTTADRGLTTYIKTAGQSQGMDNEVLMRVALEDEWQVVSCFSLPFTIFFFVIVMLFFQHYYGVTSIFLAEAGFRKEIGHPATDVAEPMAIYDWLEDRYFPYMWGARQDALPEQKRRTTSLYQELIAGVVLSTSRAREVPCEDPLMSNLDCYSGPDPGTSGQAFVETQRRLGGEGWQADAPPLHTPRDRQGSRTVATIRRWASGGRRRRPGARRLQGGPRASEVQPRSGRQLRVSRPEIRAYIPDGSTGKRSKLVIPMSTEYINITHIIDRMKEVRTIRETTLTFTTLAYVLNNNMGRELLSQVAIDFSLNRGGNVFAQVKIITIVLDELAKDPVAVLLGPAWIASLLAFSCMLPSRAIVRWRQRKLLSHFLRFSTLLEWAIVLMGWLIVCMFFMERSQIWGVNDVLKAYRADMVTAPQAERGPLETNTINNLSDKAMVACDTSMWLQTYVADYHILLVFRFFLAIRGQPRLAIVLNTIRRAFVDLLHLFIVFMIIFVAYAISGHILFGRRMEEFSTFDGAFADCFEIVMEREYDWDKFTDQDLWTSTLWVWSFLLLVVLVLVNIFLAMIFDSYGEVRSAVGDGATLWRTTVHLVHQLRYSVQLGDNTRWVSNRELIAAIKKMQCQTITPWMLKDAFPGISNKQVNYLFNVASGRLENMLMLSNKTILPQVVASILLGIEKMYKGLEQIEGGGADVEKFEHMGALGGDPTVEPPIIEGSMEDFVVGPPPDEAPRWVKAQLMPHFAKQAAILQNVKFQVGQVEQAMQDRGLGVGLPAMPQTDLKKQLAAMKLPPELGKGGGHALSPAGASLAQSAPPSRGFHSSEDEAAIPPVRSRWNNHLRASLGTSRDALGGLEPEWFLANESQVEIHAPGQLGGPDSTLCCRSSASCPRGASRGNAGGRC